MDTTTSIIIGVISDILTSVIIYILVLFLRKILLPWYEEISYRGIDINGEWHDKKVYGSGVSQETIVRIRQKGHRISGVVIFIYTTLGVEKSQIKNFRISGQFYDRLLSATCKNLDKRRMGCFNVILEVLTDGTKMKGYMSWYDVRANEIRSGECEWVRAV